MDPDQVAAAGAHGRHHHLTDATRSEGSGGAGESWPRALLRRGWDLSRKVAIVGAAATAAPVVAPPIVFLSAAGLALSVPFAAYLASLAATDRLMGALLPSFPAKPVHLYGEEYDVQQEFFDASEEPGQEARVFYCCSKTEEDAMQEENERVALASLPLSWEPGISKVEAPALLDGEDIVPQTFSFQESFVSNSRDKESTKEAVSLTCYVSQVLMPMLGGKDTVVKRVGEDGVAVQQLGQDSLVSSTGDKTEEPTMLEEKDSTKDMPLQDFNVSGTPVPIFTSEDNVVTSKVQSEVEVELAEEVAINIDIDMREVVDMHVDVVAIAAPEDIVKDLSDANIEDMQHHDQGAVCSSVSVASGLSAHDGDEDVMSSGSTPDIPAICDETSQRNRATGLGYPLMKEGVGSKVISGGKHIYTEAQLREQLETVRTITGYRSPPSSTLAGELAGLYLFVGVEPPVSSGDASDLMEINAKLRILKSIIGVD